MPCKSTEKTDKICQLLTSDRARTSIRGTQDGASACDGPRIKTEFMFGAE